MQTTIKHLTRDELEAGLEYIKKSPSQEGTVEMIVRRPMENQREIIEHGELDKSEGLVGDNWKYRGSSMTPDGSAHPEMQLNIMNSRTIELVAQSREFWSLAGDQLFIDFDLSEENVPAGTQISIGESIVEVSAVPHLGCKKFVARFGLDAMKFVNSATGKKLHLRGINAKVIKSGSIRIGDSIRKL